jgi:ribosomal protein S18 acetylase RimI-like enzyme
MRTDMTRLDHVRFRSATQTDAERVAELHALSWRLHYRGAYSDEFLDGDLLADRRQVWLARLHSPDGASETVLAEAPDGELAGFGHVVFEHDPHWGALLDNLHVSPVHQRRGLGARLLGRIAETVCDRDPGAGLYLWVLERNTRARAFYDALGGRPVETTEVPAPGGVPSRLNGSPRRLRYVWPGEYRELADRG